MIGSTVWVGSSTTSEIGFEEPRVLNVSTVDSGEFDLVVPLAIAMIRAPYGVFGDNPVITASLTYEVTVRNKLLLLLYIFSV